MGRAGTLVSCVMPDALYQAALRQPDHLGSTASVLRRAHPGCEADVTDDARSARARVEHRECWQDEIEAMHHV